MTRGRRGSGGNMCIGRNSLINSVAGKGEPLIQVALVWREGNPWPGRLISGVAGLPTNIHSVLCWFISITVVTTESISSGKSVLKVLFIIVFRSDPLRLIIIIGLEDFTIRYRWHVFTTQVFKALLARLPSRLFPTLIKKFKKVRIGLTRVKLLWMVHQGQSCQSANNCKHSIVLVLCSSLAVGQLTYFC